ncbi:MAG: FeoB-associated Cys-rich membrane protein [Flavobacteriaceae bacterium]
MNTLLTILAVLASIAYLVRRFWPRKKKSACGTSDCGCH